ncbi:MAG: RecQ family ATP-dependent DNA helicase [Fervidobacterium sp.]
MAIPLQLAEVGVSSPIEDEISNDEEMQRELTRRISEIKSMNVSSSNYLAIGILSAWLHRAIVSAIIDGVLTEQTKQTEQINRQSIWKIAVIERDVKFSDYAVTDMYKYFMQLSKLIECSIPKIDLTIFRKNAKPQEFIQDNLSIRYKHLDEYREYQVTYDLTIDIGFRQTNGELPRINATVPHITITAVNFSDDSQNSQISYISKASKFYTFTPYKYFSLSGKTQKDKDDALKFILQNVFRKTEFRDGQLKIIRRILSLNSVIGLLPTGSGKSLCYQLSGLLEPGTVVIIDPIKSLMVDQVENLSLTAIDCSAYINSDVLGKDRKERLKQMVNYELKYIFISPERLQIKSFRRELTTVANEIPIPFVVIDEAHCVSEWGHDFRPAYLNIARNIKAITKNDRYTPPLVALTGTASYAVLNDVQHELEINSESAKIYPKSFDREKLNFIILRTDGKRKEEIEQNKQEALKKILYEELPSKLNRSDVNTMISDTQLSGIIFTSKVSSETGIVGISEFLKGQNIPHEVYSGKRPQLEKLGNVQYNKYKLDVQLKFKKNKVHLLVATKAFGMGIDKPNIRYTIHYAIPSSLEAFYQEAGRAGRDKKKAYCYLIFSESRPDYTNKLLDVSRSNTEMHTEYSKLGRINDDVFTQLFFHLGSFIGEEEETELVFNFLTLIYTYVEKLDEDKCGYIVVSDNSHEEQGDNEEEDKIFDKVLQRLTILGIVQDYTIEYIKKEKDNDSFVKTYEIKVKKLNSLQVRNNLIQYFERYKSQDEVNNYIMGLDGAEESSHGLDEYKRYISQLIEFIYSEIEKQRRRALATMVEVARNARNNSEIKEYILNYFEESVFTKDLMRLQKEFNIEKINEIADKIEAEKNIDRLKNLYGNIQRFLESAPDNPAFYLLSTLDRVKIKVEINRKMGMFSGTEEKMLSENEYIISDWKNFIARINKHRYNDFVQSMFNKVSNMLGNQDNSLKARLKNIAKKASNM